MAYRCRGVVAAGHGVLVQERPGGQGIGRESGGDDHAGPVDAVPDHRALVLHQVRAFAPAETLGPLQCGGQPSVGLGGHRHGVPVRGHRDLLQGGVGTAQGDGRAPPVAGEGLRRHLPVIGHQRQLAVDPVDHGQTVLGGHQPGEPGRNDVERGGQGARRFAQPVGVHGHDTQRRAHLGKELRRNGIPGRSHALPMPRVRTHLRSRP